MAEKKTKNLKQVKTLTHGDAARKNIPTAEYQALIEKEQADPLLSQHSQHVRQDS